jgi:glyoxylase-like metal-dependent hydrolase (beta-lactamase superfamily II)
MNRALLTTTFFILSLLAASLRAETGVKLYVFDCGNLRTNDISMFSISNEETPIRELFVPCYLVEHPDGLLLWDAGLPTVMAEKGEFESEPGVFVRYDTPLEDQLAAMDLRPEDIDLVAFSHMHWDHVGSANLFTESTLLIQQPEYQSAFIDNDNDLFQPELYMGLAENNMQILDGDHDVFGDGSVQLISAYGHTPGHQLLFLRLENTGPLVLSGDLYHFRLSREQRRVPVFNSNAEDTLHAMAKVEALLKRENATLWIEHDKALADTLRKAPGYYD